MPGLLPNSLGVDLSTQTVSSAQEQSPLLVSLAGRPPPPPCQTAIGTSGKYTVGVLLAPNLESVDRRTADNPVEAAEVAFKETAALSSKTFDSFLRLASTGQTEDV